MQAVHVRAAGPVGAPAIVLVHGWAAAGDAWAGQLESDALTSRYRLLAPDLRGHGDSYTPDGGYDDPESWAADLDVVLEQCEGPALLVGWSYGGLVLTDYLRARGSSRVAGLVLAGALTELGRGRPGGHVGAAMRAAIPDVLADEPDTAVPALAALMGRMTAEPLPGAYLQRMIGISLRTPPAVRAAMFGRTVDSGELLAGLDVPTLVVHGTEDVVVDPKSAEYALGKISGARACWFQGVGHMPFVERAAEFDHALLEFAGQCLG